MVVERRRRERRFDLAAVGEEPQRVAADRDVETAGNVLTGEELGERLRVDDGTGEAVVADLAALLDHHDGDLGARRRRELPQSDRTGQRGRTCADEEDVDFEGIALSHDPPAFAPRHAGSPAVARLLRGGENGRDEQAVGRNPFVPRPRARRLEGQ